MPRGSHKVKPAKTEQTETSAPSSIVTKLTRRNTDWKASISKPTFMSRNLSETKMSASSYEQAPLQRAMTTDFMKRQTEVPTQLDSTIEPTILLHPITAVDSTMATGVAITVDMAIDNPSNDLESITRPSLERNPSSISTEYDSTNESAFETLEDLTLQEAQSSSSSCYSRDSLSTFSSDSASIYSSASSIYSSGASLYSFDEEAETSSDPRIPGRSQYPQRPRPRRTEVQDAASRERSTLAKKAALFKNSKLSPNLPSFSSSLPTWSMVCRAAQASADCYDSESLTRRGTYIPADQSQDIKAMIVDEQRIDDTRLVVVAIRGTQFTCVADWSVNKAANPVKPVGFLDDKENACHAGFLQVAVAMVSQVAAQLQTLSASSEKTSLVFTGHSAGGAVASLLYSHMLCTSTASDLTKLANDFPSINCITFGAPPVSLTPLPKRGCGNGVFLSFANEGDPVLRLSNAAYVKSLVKLMTASPPSSIAATRTVKVVRHSRGTRVIRQTLPSAPQTPWEELPLWPTPPAPLTNAGDVILLRDKEDRNAVAAHVTAEELSDVIFGDLAQHTVDMYMRRVKDVAFAAMMGRSF